MPAGPSLPPISELLRLEEIDRDLYRGINEVPDNDIPQLYGGQVAAQALMAAGLTVPAGRHPHSLHGYFLRRGRRDHPVIFRVDRDRDGRSFSSRRVSALQHGEVIFDLAASFHLEEPGNEYAVPMPADVPAPDDCTTARFIANVPSAEVRPIPPLRVVDERVTVSNRLWVRVREQLADDRLLHACALTYLSDLGSGFHAHDITDLPAGGPSLDHAVWFHTPLRADHWILFHMWPLMAGGARGLYMGSMHQRDGLLGAMVTQESLLRPHR